MKRLVIAIALAATLPFAASAADGISYEQFRQELLRQLTLQRLREREVDARVRVSEPEIDQFLREQSPQGGELAGIEMNIAQVLVVLPEGASDAQVSAAQARAHLLGDPGQAAFAAADGLQASILE